jgi:hypothetical protein
VKQRQVQFRWLTRFLVLASIIGIASVGAQPPPLKTAGSDLFRFRIQEIDPAIKVGYGVVTADVNGDGKLDIVVADTNEVVWYENSSWQKRVVIKGQTKEDNVCLAAADIDGDGQVDFAIGADWQPGFRGQGTIQWVKRGATLEEPWTVHPIGEEPTAHRMRFLDLEGDGKLQLVVAPLMGRNSTRSASWTDGRPVRILAYAIPADPVKGPWTPRVLSETLHVVHGFGPIAAEKRSGLDLLIASFEGISRISAPASRTDPWDAKLISAGNQESPGMARGASEVRVAQLKNGKQAIASIEPWHGNQFVVYTIPIGPDKTWERQVVDSRLRWGHAIACADLDGDGADEIIVGIRDDPRSTDTFTDRRGVRVYRGSEDGARWDRQLVDPGNVAVEDLTAADLNGDKRIDIIAVGRATGNVRIYWNER